MHTCVSGANFNTRLCGVLPGKSKQAVDLSEKKTILICGYCNFVKVRRWVRLLQECSAVVSELLISEKERIFQELFFLPLMTHRFVDFVMESSIISRISTHITFNIAPWQRSSSLLQSYGLDKKKIYLPAVSSPIPSLIQPQNHSPSSRAPYHRVSASWFQGLSLGTGNKTKEHYPDIVKAGDPVLHEPAADVEVDQIGSENIQNIIDQMIREMRKAPGVGLAAPQIGVPLKIVVLEDTREYISYASKSEVEAQDRRPFDLLVIVNPKLKMKSNKTAFFFEGCLSLDGYRALVERNLEVEVTGYDRDGKPIKVNATGWQARILQHECDHLEGTVYVDRMVPRTFRTVENLALPLATGCPKLGPR